MPGKPQEGPVAAGVDVDRHVGRRIRERRVLIGLSQQQVADLVGVTYQQAHKHEKGINRVAAGRLLALAAALGVGVDYFYQGLERGRAGEPAPQRKTMLELARNFAVIADPRRQAALCALARVLATAEPGDPERGG